MSNSIDLTEISKHVVLAKETSLAIRQRLFEEPCSNIGQLNILSDRDLPTKTIDTLVADIGLLLQEIRVRDKALSFFSDNILCDECSYQNTPMCSFEVSGDVCKKGTSVGIVEIARRELAVEDSNLAVSTYISKEEDSFATE